MTRQRTASAHNDSVGQASWLRLNSRIWQPAAVVANRAGSGCRGRWRMAGRLPVQLSYAMFSLGDTPKPRCVPRPRGASSRTSRAATTSASSPTAAPGLPSQEAGPGSGRIVDRCRPRRPDKRDRRSARRWTCGDQAHELAGADSTAVPRASTAKLCEATDPSVTRVPSRRPGRYRYLDDIVADRTDHRGLESRVVVLVAVL